VAKKDSACFCTDMTRPGKGELGDLDHMAEYKHILTAPKDKEKAVKSAEKNIRKAGHRMPKNKGRY
jgi:hypothetical protein